MLIYSHWLSFQFGAILIKVQNLKTIKQPIEYTFFQRKYSLRNKKREIQDSILCVCVHIYHHSLGGQPDETLFHLEFDFNKFATNTKTHNHRNSIDLLCSLHFIQFKMYATPDKVWMDNGIQ